MNTLVWLGYALTFGLVSVFPQYGLIALETINLVQGLLCMVM